MWLRVLRELGRGFHLGTARGRLTVLSYLPRQDPGMWFWLRPQRSTALLTAEQPGSTTSPLLEPARVAEGKACEPRKHFALARLCHRLPSPCLEPERRTLCALPVLVRRIPASC